MALLNFISKFSLYLKGIFIGLCFVIPGVSAGTAALITHLYIPLINWVNDIRKTMLRKHPLRSLLHTTLGLTPVLVGVVLGFLLTVHWVSYLIQSYPLYVFSFFSGAILASTLILYRRVHLTYMSISISLLLGLISFGLLFISIPMIQTHFIWFLFSIFLAVGAMVLPGVSGSYILILMGTYHEFLNLFTTVAPIKWLLVGLVVVISVFTVSMWIQMLLKKHKSYLMAGLIGLTVGGAVGVFPFKVFDSAFEVVISSVGCFILGLSSFIFYRKS